MYIESSDGAAISRGPMLARPPVVADVQALVGGRGCRAAAAMVVGIRRNKTRWSGSKARTEENRQRIHREGSKQMDENETNRRDGTISSSQSRDTQMQRKTKERCGTTEYLRSLWSSRLGNTGRDLKPCMLPKSASWWLNRS